MKHHRKIHSGKKLLQCDQCDKSFIWQSTLNVHLRAHSGERPFQCHQCDKSFIVKGNLTVHLRTTQ